MFRQKRDDTEVGSIEDTYNINLNARRDMKLGNLLDERGFESQSQLLKAYQRSLTYHARKRRVFLSFDYDDRAQVQGFRLMVQNPNVELDLHDRGLQNAVNSEDMGYVHQVIKKKIERTEVLLVLIGDATVRSKEVAWEIQTAIEAGKGICGIRLKSSRGHTPSLLAQNNAPVASWGDTQDLIAVIECAAARRS